MDGKSRQSLFYLMLEANKNPITVFTDLDKTSCEEGNAEFASINKEETGKEGCYMQPDLRRVFEKLPDIGCGFNIVTGRHWSDVRVNDLTGEKIPDGAFHDLLGGVESFEKVNAVAGHGRLVVQDGKTTVLRRGTNEEDALKEQKFERYVGENVLKLKEELFEKWPDSRGVILAEYKKHLSYVNVAEYQKKNPTAGTEMAAFVDEKMKAMMTSKEAPENPNGALYYTVEPTGSMEVRSKNQSKRNGLEQSGFLQAAFDRGGPVLVLGDSLGKNGTDRDMVEATRDFFNERGAGDRVYVIHVLNGEKNRITDPNDKCFPNIAVENPNELGTIMKMVGGRAQLRWECHNETKNAPVKKEPKKGLTTWSELYKRCQGGR